MNTRIIALFALFVSASAAFAAESVYEEAVAVSEKSIEPCVRLTDVPPPGPRTAAAKEADITGSSVLQVGIDRAGFIFDVVVEKSLGYGLDELCEATARKNRWKPATWKGVPIFCNFRATCTWRKSGEKKGNELW